MTSLQFATAPLPGTLMSGETLEDDGRLVTLAKTDPRAFAPLYHRYFDLVYRYCYRRLGHPETAADATGQVFTKALAALPRFRDDAGSFRSWLFAIAHNVLVDEVRSYRPTAELIVAADVPSSAPSPEDETISAETGRVIRGLLNELTQDQRQIMELRLAGLTGPEIATTLGRSLGSVKIAQVRAIARMRVILNQQRHSRLEAPGGR